jgi:hypothetical protein
MEKVLLVLAVAFAVIAITSRHKLHHMEPPEDSPEAVDSALKADEHRPESLAYALNKMTNTQARPPQPLPPMPAKSGAPSKEELVKAVQKEIETIQLSTPDSPAAFEKALNLTSAPENLALRLTVYQAALNMQFDSIQSRNLALREVTGTQVALQNDNATPDETSQHELQRNVVTTAYKVYVMTSSDPELVYNDTAQALSFQSDPWVRRQIIFECVSRFPQLRERINE